jgi:hypothetical protein
VVVVFPAIRDSRKYAIEALCVGLVAGLFALRGFAVPLVLPRKPRLEISFQFV